MINSYNVGPLSARMSLSEFSKITYSTSKELLDKLSKNLEDKLPYLPDYVSRSLKADKVIITNYCNVISVNYNISITVDEEKMYEDLRKIVEKNGLKLLEVKSGWFVDTPCYTLILGGEERLHFSNESITKEAEIKKEITTMFKPLHAMFKFNLDYECF